MTKFPQVLSSTAFEGCYAPTFLNRETDCLTNALMLLLVVLLTHLYALCLRRPGYKAAMLSELAS